MHSGQKTLKEAVDKAFEAYQNEYKTALYAIGSVVGPHPFPSIVEYFQSVIGKESREQFINMTGGLPDCVIACVGGGSNAIGMFDGFIDDKEVELYGIGASWQRRKDWRKCSFFNLRQRRNNPWV